MERGRKPSFSFSIAQYMYNIQTHIKTLTYQHSEILLGKFQKCIKSSKVLTRQRFKMYKTISIFSYNTHLIYKNSVHNTTIVV